MYYTAVGLEKCDREQRTDREQTEKAITEATLILMDRRVERANFCDCVLLDITGNSIGLLNKVIHQD